ncbi:AraC family transcriptional regulator [Novosphingobium mangrovi (ex Huang et al. 2023)]|uniref:AraC family transcriptional regulator n=1 Tax=Novosphingobium mangrovi (ex Huang et al. 2023) TaxID=2976432 RepID=A0ABT2I5P8_9SPHN|nr:AraC family transcriptional regulator [Novosphingobium mangrovi (ex Huang et al. 2023)]MCT2399913.1 AraC family transcriptional regulator [Novosphingobium mangrovi (ex Huang et al. 2023)]
MLHAEAEGEFERLNAPLLRHFASLVNELGGDLPDLLRRADIDEDTFADGSGSLTYRQAIRLLEIAAEALACPDLGMRLAFRQRGGRMFGPLGQVMRNSRTFGEALKFACDHSNAHSRAARLWLQQVTDEGHVFAGHELLLGNIANRAQAMEQILLIGHLEAMEMTGGYARARRIHFRHEPVAPRETYRRQFGCEVCFGEPVDGMVFSAEDLASPILQQSHRIHQEMVAFIERNFPHQRLPFHAEVRGLIMRRLAQGDCSNSEVARAMNIHHRTLRRRLTQEGSRFQAVKDEVRRDLTLYYLERTALDFRSISEKLGFAEQSIFSRSCRRWFGQSPSKLRQALLEPVAPGHTGS